jgi:hypothetical protein
MAAWAIAPDVRSGRVVTRRFGRRGLRRRWYAAVHARRVPEYLRAFIDQVRRVAPSSSRPEGRGLRRPAGG